MGSEGRVSTKQQLLALIEDIDLITRQLFETLSQQSSHQAEVPNADSQNAAPQRMDVDQLTDLLLKKNKELEEKMNTVGEQQQLHSQIERLETDIIQRNKEIECLQKHLKEAEYLLSTALYQAKEKLKSINQARKGAVPSEEIIKYAHKISAACATAAPLNWALGDPRRPYPQDIEMRCGWLGQMNSLNDPSIKPPPQLGTEGLAVPSLVGTGLSAQAAPMPAQWGAQPAGDGKVGPTKKGEDDVEVMSSDSSSSSSSDSSFGND